MRSSKLFTIIPLLLLIFLTLSCSDSTKPKKASVVGVVVLVGLNSFEGVSVSLYKAGLVDGDIQAVHNEHTSLGFGLADIHVFDHRDYAPVYTTTTSSDGSFEVKGVERNKYILVLLKEGFGHRYLYDLELDSDVVEANNGEDIHLFEVIELPQYVDGENLFGLGPTCEGYKGKR